MSGKLVLFVHPSTIKFSDNAVVTVDALVCRATSYSPILQWSKMEKKMRVYVKVLCLEKWYG